MPSSQNRIEVTAPKRAAKSAVLEVLEFLDKRVHLIEELGVAGMANLHLVQSLMQRFGKSLRDVGAYIDEQEKYRKKTDERLTRLEKLARSTDPR